MADDEEDLADVVEPDDPDMVDLEALDDDDLIDDDDGLDDDDLVVDDDLAVVDEVESTWWCRSRVVVAAEDDDDDDDDDDDLDPDDVEAGLDVILKDRLVVVDEQDDDEDEVPDADDRAEGSTKVVPEAAGRVRVPVVLPGEAPEPTGRRRRACSAGTASEAAWRPTCRSTGWGPGRLLGMEGCRPATDDDLPRLAELARLGIDELLPDEGGRRVRRPGGPGRAAGRRASRRPWPTPTPGCCAARSTTP